MTSHSVPQKGETVAEGKALPTPEEIVASDYEKIAVHLKPENTAGDEWKQINNYAATPEKLVSKDSAAGYFKTAQSNIPDIYSCLKKDFCGMTTRNEDDAYFDDQKTPAHILINRNLKIMKEALRKDISLKSQVDWELMQTLAAEGSEMLSVEALDIIREFDSDSVKTDELIKLTSDYKGTAKADALERISKKEGASDKLLLASEVEETFATGDADTVISVLEKVKNMNFKQTDLPKVLRNLCVYKDNPEQERNWKMIKYQATKVYSDFEKICN